MPGADRPAVPTATAAVESRGATHRPGLVPRKGRETPGGVAVLVINVEGAN